MEIKAVKKTKRVQELEFVFACSPRPYSLPLTLDAAAGDEIRFVGDKILVSIHAPEGSGVLEMNRAHLLYYSTIERVIELPEEGQSALSKHLESLRQEQEAPGPSPQPKA